MNTTGKRATQLITGLLLICLYSIEGRSQMARGRGQIDDSASPKSAPIQAATTPALSPGAVGEKIIRDAYTRLMRYQSASMDGIEQRGDQKVGPDDYLTFELYNIRSGSISDISARPLRELVTLQDTPLMSVRPVHLSEKGGPAHAYYEATWAPEPKGGGPKATGADNTLTTDDLLKDMSATANFNQYTSYEVRLHFQGKQVSYRALALYQLESAQLHSATKPSMVKIIDNVTFDMNAVYGDESPRVRAPWSHYVKSSLYLAVAESIKKSKEAGKPLIPLNMPIGYLPGDDLPPVDPPITTSACTGPRITGATNVWWFNGETPTNYDTSITLTASPTGASSYSWSVVSGGDKISLSNFVDNTARVTGVNASTFHEVGIRVTVDGITSPTFNLSVRAPNRVVLIRAFVQAADTTFGYDTQIHYRIEDQFTDVLPANVPINEHFTTGIIADFAGMNWRRGPEGGGLVGPSDWADDINGETAGHTPTPTNPCSPSLCSTKVYHWDGQWSVGSATIGNGRRVQTNTWQKFTDHAEHTNRTSPAP